jgi:hypothetical protein
MSRLLFAAVAAVLSLATSASSLAAQPRQPIREQFVDMGEYVVNGAVTNPRINLTNGRKAAQFGRLMSLKKDLVPGIFAARQDPAFK